MNKAKQIAKMWLTLSENEGAYFEYRYANLDIDGERASGTPDMDSDLKDWRVHIPPKKWKPSVKQWTAFLDLERIYQREKGSEIDRLSRDIKRLATLSARVDELDGRMYFVYDENNYHIAFNSCMTKYEIVTDYRTQYLNTIYMTEKCADQILKELKSGYLELDL